MSAERQVPLPCAVVINDDITQLTLLAELLLRNGFSVWRFADADSALLHLKTGSPPDIIISDIYMPGIDGWRLCRLLRSWEYSRLNTVPILVVSATFSGEIPKRIARDIGATDFMSAPVDGAEFIARVRALIRGRIGPGVQKVLLLTDSENLSHSVRKDLDTRGLELDCMSAIGKAETAFKKGDIDVVIIDESLVDEEGEQWLESLRTQRPGSILLLIASDPQPEPVLAWHKKGGAGVLRKPYNSEEFHLILEKAKQERYILHAEDLLEKRTRALRENETRLDRIAEVLVSLDRDSAQNIDNLVRHCGEILKADCAVYNRLDQGAMHSAAQWNTPEGFQVGPNPQGTICNEVIKSGGRKVQIFRNLGGSPFSRSDANIRAHKYETYMGCPVMRDGDVLGVVCVFYVKDIEPTGADLRILGIIASALGREEERIQAESLLRLQALVLDQIEDRVTVTDLQGRISYVNNAELRALGYSREELLGFTTEKYGEDAQRGATQAEILNETLEKGRWHGEVINKTRDGHELVMDCRTQLVSDERGNPRALCGIATDITERKRVENALKESEKRYETIYNNMRIGLFRSTPRGRLVWVNKAMVSIYGFSSQEELLKRSAVDYYSDNRDRERMLALLDKEDRAVDFVSRELKKDGTEIWVSCDYQAVRDEAGRLKFIDGLVLDITDRKRLEETREKLQSQLLQAQKMESVGRLAGGVAHDFNNMLGVILGHTEMMLDSISQAHPMRSDLQEIFTAADRSAQLTRQLLSFARKQTIDPRLLDLNRVVSGMLSMLRRMIGEDIRLHWKPGKGLGRVKIDPAQIDQVLANLCVNARDAIENTGTIVIETHALTVVDACSLDHAAVLPGDYVVLTVTDDGCGMDQDVLGKLFEPFFTTKETGKGTGLGLATVYGILKQNGGFISVTSEMGKGSRFTLYFPVSNETSEGQGASVLSPNSDGGRETILLVEDEAAILGMTTQMLERLGYRVIPASGPAMAMKLAESWRGQIDLQITDVIMPDMNGRDLAARLADLNPGMKVLFISGYTADAIAQHGVLEDGVQFLQKPFSIKDLAFAVRRALGKETPV